MSGYNINNDEQFRLKQIYNPVAPTQTLRNLEVSNINNTNINNTTLTSNSCYIGGYPKGINVTNVPFNCSNESTGYGRWIAASLGSSLQGDRVVIGNAFGYIGATGATGGATIGSHSYNLTYWTPLNVMYPVLIYPSDETVKENIIDANLDICYNNINTLTLKRFKYKDHISYKKEDTNQLGVLAQDLQKIFKKSVNEMPALNEEVNGPDAKTLGINTDQLFYCMLGCIQSLQKKNESQQLIINSNINIIQSHESRINKLENLLNTSN